MSVTKYTFPPQYNTVKDFDLYDTCEYGISEFCTLPFRKQIQPTQTKASEASQSFSILEAQRQKISKQRIQTSFHGKLLDQHIECVEKNIFQFLEKSFPQFKNLPKQTLLRQIYGQDSDPTQSTEKLNQLLKKDNIYFDEIHRNQFLTRLFYEEPLYDFLSLLCNITHSKLALEVAFISSLFCKIHGEEQKINMRQDQIESLVEEALESEYFSQELLKLQFLALRRCEARVEIDQSELEENIKNLLGVMGITIILVMEEYFMNRFSKQDQSSQLIKKTFNLVDISNDEYSDDENEFHFSEGHKKRKA